MRLLVREKERESARWRQFETLMSGKANMPEPGFALALHSQVAGDAPSCQGAVRWALGDTSDLRQLALVFDWCQAAMDEQQAAALAGKLEKGMATGPREPGVSAMRDRVLAAIALGERAPAVSERILETAVETWWRGVIVPAIGNRRDALPRDEMLALFEILHAMRDNFGMDLRESIPGYFRDLPLQRLLSYYPASYPASENEYHIPALKGGGEPDLRRAALFRAADLSLVAYDPNSKESQFLLGWLMRDPFLMRSPFGIPYEFLWANPYMPGLSYYHAPLFQHDSRVGRLFLRSSWDEDATWLGYFEGELQVFAKDGLKIIRQQPASKPIRLGDAAVVMASGASPIQLDGMDVRAIYLLGLRPGAAYEIRGAKRRRHPRNRR